MQPTAEEFEYFRQRVEEVPFLRLLDIKLERLGRGEAEMSMTVSQKHLQTMGIVHGGVIASILDSVTWWAAFAAQQPGDSAKLMSADLKLNYLSALKSGRATARATCKKAGSRLCYAVGEIFDEAGRLVADGSSTLLVVR
ncbi:MAG: PaaI family thioesterase [Myxococcales bacterium]|nr:PaaI family thioesterase [Myxococcales bacterium]